MGFHFPGLIVEHFYVKFGDPSCTTDILRKTAGLPWVWGFPWVWVWDE